MVIVTTIGGLAATGISYVSSMNTITGKEFFKYGNVLF